MCSVASALHRVSTQHEAGDVICFYHARFGKRANKCRPHASIRETPWPSPIVSAVTGPFVSCLFCLCDGPSGLEFLIDTGAEGKCFPATSMVLCSARHDCTLLAANGIPIRTFGTCFVSFHVNARWYSWDFVVADVRRPLLGADFLCHYRLLMDMKGCQLVDGASFFSFSFAGNLCSGTAGSSRSPLLICLSTY